MADYGDGTATISGTPNQVTSSTTSNFTVTATDDNGNGTDRAFSDVGRFGNKGMLVTRKKPKAKKMKRGGLASKK